MTCLVILMAMLCHREAICQYIATRVIGSTYNGTRTNGTAKMLSDKSATLSSIHWCKYWSYFTYLSFRFSNGEKINFGSCNYATAGSITGLDSYVFTSACFPFNQWSWLNPKVRLLYDGGSVNFGGAPGGGCTTKEITGKIDGVQGNTDGTGVWWVKFLTSCEYSDDPAGPTGPADTTIDLLLSSTQTFANQMGPGIISDPLDCWQVQQFTLHRASDDANLVTTYPSAFVNTGSEFTLTLAYDNPDLFTIRQELFGSGTESYYVKRTIQGVTNTSFKEYVKYPFTVTYRDDCRSATLTPQSISLSDVTWTDGHAAFWPDPTKLEEDHQVPAFTDSVDATGHYSNGACGEKLVSFDSPPTFMTVTKDATDPIANDLTITYTEAQANPGDVKLTHTVDYTVTSKEYGSYINSVSDSFTVTIVCPDHVLDSTSSIAEHTGKVYDIPRRLPLKLDLPVVTLTPPDPCFSYNTFKAYDQATGTEITDWITIDDSNSKVVIETDDVNLVDIHTIELKAVILESPEELPQTVIHLEITDTCRDSTIEGTIDIKPVTVNKGEDISVIQHFDILTDKTSTDYGIVDDCGPLTYSIVDSNGQPPPPFVHINYNQGDTTFSLEVNGKDFEDEVPVTFELFILAQLDEYLSYVPTVSFRFTVVVKDPCKTSRLADFPEVDPIVVQAGEPTYTYTYDILTDSISDAYNTELACGLVQYELLLADGLSVPDFISLSYTEGDPTFNIEIDVKTYQSASVTLYLKVRAYLVDYTTDVPSEWMWFTLQVKELDTFLFVPAPPVEPTPVPEPPPIIVDEEDTEETEPQIAEPVAQPPSEDVIDAGAQAQANEIRQGVNDNQTEFPFPRPQISSATQTGLIDVKFSMPLKQIPASLDLTKLKFEDKSGRRDLQNDGATPKYKSVITVTIEPSTQQDPERVKFSWQLTKMTKEQMTIQILFESAKYISFDEPDTLVIEFHDPDLFITDNGIQIKPEHRRIERKLMRQLPSDAQSTQENINSSVANQKQAASYIMVGNFLLGFGLKSVLDMINALQIIILLPLIGTKVPANAGMFFSTLTEIAAFDFFEIGEYVNEFLELSPTEPLPSFEANGMESTYFINNLGTFYLILLFYSLLVIIWLIVYLIWRIIQKKGLKRLKNKLKHKIFWNGLIVTIMESFMMLALCALLSMRLNFGFDTYGDKVQNISVIVTLAIYIIVPIIVLISVLKNFKYLDTPRMRRLFGEFYANLEVKNGKKVLVWPIYFLIRRLYLTYLIVFGTEVFAYLMAQIMLSTGIAAILPYVLHSFKEKGERRTNANNEMLTLFSCYIFTTFNIIGVDDNFMVGYLVIGVLGTYILFVILYVVWTSIKAACVSLRFCCLRRKYVKSRAKLQQYLKSTHDTRQKRFMSLRGIKSSSTKPDRNPQTALDVLGLNQKQELEVIEEEQVEDTLFEPRIYSTDSDPCSESSESGESDDESSSIDDLREDANIDAASDGNGDQTQKAPSPLQNLQHDDFSNAIMPFDGDGQPAKEAPQRLKRGKKFKSGLISTTDRHQQIPLKDKTSSADNVNQFVTFGGIGISAVGGAQNNVSAYNEEDEDEKLDQILDDIINLNDFEVPLGLGISEKSSNDFSHFRYYMSDDLEDVKLSMEQ